MKDIAKNLFTHGAAGGLGYFLGKRNNSKIVHHSLFSRFIPTVLFAGGIAYFAFKTPDAVEKIITKSSDNNTKLEILQESNDYKLKDKALDKGFDIYKTRTKEHDAIKSEYDAIKNEYEALKEEKNILQERNALQENNIRSIESKLDSIISCSNTPSIDTRLDDESDSKLKKYDNRRPAKNYSNRQSGKKTVIHRDIYMDPYGMRPPIVVERRVSRNYR